MKPPVTPILLPPAAMKALVGKLTRRVLADPKIQAYLAKEEAARKAALPAGSVGKSARATVADAKTAALIRKLDVRLKEYGERYRAGRQAAYTARVDEIVEKVAEARAIAKSAPAALRAAGAEPLKELRQIRAEVRETAEKFSRFAETLTKDNGTRDARPRRIQ